MLPRSSGLSGAGGGGCWELGTSQVGLELARHGGLLEETLTIEP